MTPGIQGNARAYRRSTIRPRLRGSPPVASWGVFPFGQWRLGVLPFKVADSRVVSRGTRCHIPVTVLEAQCLELPFPVSCGAGAAAFA